MAGPFHSRDALCLATARPPKDSYIAGCGRKRCHCVMTGPVADNAQMSPRSCLNEYQLQFLKLLVDRRCRFLIIGGQARSIHEGAVTRDLDVWVDISSANRPTLDLTLLAWATEHRMHSSADFSQTPLQLRPCVQIKFPECNAFFIGADG